MVIDPSEGQVFERKVPQSFQRRGRSEAARGDVSE
jgi:hypothetical protein